jgi:hypothetical protein
MLFLVLLALVPCSASLTKFLHWAVKESFECGVPSTPVSVIPNFVFCGNSAAVFSLHTQFEGTPHSFGITACDDNKIFLGLRVENNVLVYMEFEDFHHFSNFFSECVTFAVSRCVCYKQIPLAHLTVSNKPHPGLDALLLSCKPWGIQTRVLGMGSTTPIGHETGGFGLKLKLLKKELELLPPEQLILFTDAYDVIIQQSLDTLEAWLTEHPDKVLFAAESAKWPLDIEDLYPAPLHFPSPYLNSGVFAGSAKSVLSLLQVPFTNTTDDQGYYTRQFLAGSCIVLDHEAKFFQCMVGLQPSQFLIKDKRFEFTHSSGLKSWTSAPSILHLNNGTTRAKYFTKVILTVLGPQYKYLARQVSLRLVSDFLKTNWKTIGFYVCIIVFLVTLIIKYT